MSLKLGSTSRHSWGVRAQSFRDRVKAYLFLPARAYLLIFMAIVLLQSPTVIAAELKGVLGSELYVWKETGKHHVRPYESIQANLLAWHGPNSQSLSFHTYLRWTSDFSSKLPGDPNTFVYDTYLKLTDLPRGTTLMIGRQFVYSATGSALLDGARIRYNLPLQLKMDLFGGSDVSNLDPKKIQSFSKFGVIGAGLSHSLNSSTHFGLEWLRKQSEGQTSFNRASLYAESAKRGFTFYGRIAYNLFNSGLAEIITRGAYSFKAWHASAEFNMREPSVASNTLFSIIDFRSYKQIRLEARRAILSQLAVVAGYHQTFLQGDNSWRGSIGINLKNYSIGWQHQKGYAGDNDGIYGNIILQLNTGWQAYSNVSLFRYRIQEMQPNRNDAYAANAGINWRSLSGIDVRLEGQYLRNAVQKDDIRLYMKLSNRFSLGHATERVMP